MWDQAYNINNLNTFFLSCRKKCFGVQDGRNYLYRVEKFRKSHFVYVWVASNGCAFAKKGFCSFCYNADFSVYDEATVSDNCFSALNEIEKLGIDIDSLLIAPSGSFYDDNEFSKNNRLVIYEKINAMNVENLLFETRAETITEDKLLETIESMPHKNVEIAFGLESIDDHVRNYIYNKGLNIDYVEKALQLTQKYNIYLSINVLFGAPFLSEEDRISDTVKTTRWILKRGGVPVIFPMHVRQNTGIRKLYDDKLYMPPSVWDFVELLNTFSDNELRKVIIAWHKIYNPESTINTEIIDSFKTCKKCYAEVLMLLDEFRATSNPMCIRKLNSIKCSCRK